MSKPFTVDSHVRTRDGREARIYAVDGGGDRPIHGAVKSTDTGNWFLVQWSTKGVFCSTTVSPLDLLHVPETRTVTVKIYLMEDGRINAHPAALEPHISGAFGSQTVELTFEEGRHG